MARKLPWTAGTSTTLEINTRKSTSTSPRSPSAKRRKLSTPTKPKPEPPSHQPSLLDFSSPLSSPKRPRPDNRNNGRQGHAPSTSPPPAPPNVEYMREGLDKDDAYTMVEDEFYDVAKGFTAHLHHAEYKRLMREAKERKMAQKQGFGFASMEIPETATHETRQRLKRNALEEQQTIGLRGMLGDGRLVDSSGEGEEDEVKREEKKVGDPWAGTTLAGLMGYEPGSAKTSLKGLEEVRSGTRAAQGYGPSTTRAERAAREGSEEETDAVQVGKEQKASTEHKAEAIETTSRSRVAEKTSKDKPDPLLASRRLFRDQPSSSRLGRTAQNEPTFKATIKKEKDETSSPPIKQEETQEQRFRKSAPQRKYHKFIDDLDDFDDERFERTKQVTTQSRSVSPIKAIPRPRLIKKEKDDGRERDRTYDRLDEVPVFLA